MGEQIAWAIIKPVLYIISVVLLAIFVMWLIFTHPRPKADNPEEWQAISTDASRPDTMIAYREGNTIHYQFKTNK